LNHFRGCLVCGADLTYEQHNRALVCYYCQTEVQANVLCENDHYVCDRCHSNSANDLIEHLCINSQSTNPLQLANSLFYHPAVKMHGPEHHFLVPAVLLAAFYNKKNQPELKDEKIKIARQRASYLRGGSCGSCGTCGAAVGTGIFISLITEATPLSRDAWGLSNMVTAESLHRIAAQGGPRCCKRVSYLAIQTAIKFLKSHFKVTLQTTQNLQCGFSSMNTECLRQDCPFFKNS
jgi:hypothetical protein